MALLITKMAMFGIRKTHVWLTENKCTHNVSLFGADFGQEGPYFFENDVATVNDARYRDMITQFFLPKLDDIDMANMWFQQDDDIHEDYMTYSQWNNSITAWDISWSCTLSFW